MKILTYWVVGSVVLGFGFLAICMAVDLWKRRADLLAALYG